MTAMTLRYRWRMTFRQMRAAVQSPQRMLPLGKPASWKRFINAGWVMYQFANVRRVRGMPGMAFDALVVVAFLVLGAANLVL